jgi:hypothetical protein
MSIVHTYFIVKRPLVLGSIIFVANVYVFLHPSRSTRTVVDISNAVISKAGNGRGQNKHVFTSAQEGPKACAVACRTDKCELLVCDHSWQDRQVRVRARVKVRVYLKTLTPTLTLTLNLTLTLTLTPP